MQPLNVLLIIGSTREGRFGPVPAAWAAERARERNDISLDVVDLAETALPTVLPNTEDGIPDSVTDLGTRLQAADAVVIVTPVYNRSYPASLKNAIDWFHDEWFATPVGFVSYGGRTGGIEAVEHLRGVFAELGTMTIRHVLSFPNYPEIFGDVGPDNTASLDIPTEPAEAFYDQLIWWATALRTAKLGTAAEVPT